VLIIPNPCLNCLACQSNLQSRCSWAHFDLSPVICSITGTAFPNRTDRSGAINVWVVTPIIVRCGDETVRNFRKVLRLMRVSVIKTKYAVMSRDQTAELRHSMKIGNSSFEREEEFRYLGTTLTNQNFMQEEIKSRLKLRNACCHSVQNLLSSSLLCKNLKTKIYRTIILPILYGCATWSLTLRVERRLRVFENRVLRRIFGRKRDEITREWRKLHNEERNDLFPSPNIVRVTKSRGIRWPG